IEVLQPCVTYNKKNTYEWYAKRVYKINEDPSYNLADKTAALQKAAEWEGRIPIGVIYRKDGESYEDKSGLNKNAPLVEEKIEAIDINEALKEFAR
ncbi:MAG: 2-oxoacid ferredoxin oxidoreductase, partial [Candidatus Omnitrophota bacterium]